MAEIDRQQASRQKQAPEKQPERAPQSRAAPQTAAAFLQALLAGAGVRADPTADGGTDRRADRQQRVGRAGRRPQTAGQADAFAAGGLRHGTTGNRGLRPCREPGARLAGAAPAGYGRRPAARSLGEPAWGWQFFAPGVTGGAARWNRGKRKGCCCLFWKHSGVPFQNEQGLVRFRLRLASRACVWETACRLPEGPGGGLWPPSRSLWPKRERPSALCNQFNQQPGPRQFLSEQQGQRGPTAPPGRSARPLRRPASGMAGVFGAKRRRASSVYLGAVCSQAAQQQ